MKHILFICTGNTCRSSMAEGIFNSWVAVDDRLKGQIISSSAGIEAFEGDNASASSIKVLKDKYGVDITNHRSRMVDVKILQDSDLILTMTRDHKRAILSKYPELINKVYTLKEFALDLRNDKVNEEDNFAMDITDPYGMTLQVYARCASDINDSIQKTVLKLKKQSFFDMVQPML